MLGQEADAERRGFARAVAERRPVAAAEGRAVAMEGRPALAGRTIAMERRTALAGRAVAAFAGRTVVVTGTFHDLKRRDLEKALADRGAKVTGSVAGATSLLVVGANPGADKTAAAARFGTPKMDETALREALGLPAAVEQMSLF